jgi:hypothetical protein
MRERQRVPALHTHTQQRMQESASQGSAVVHRRRRGVMMVAARHVPSKQRTAATSTGPDAVFGAPKLHPHRESPRGRAPTRGAATGKAATFPNWAGGTRGGGGGGDTHRTCMSTHGVEGGRGRGTATHRRSVANAKQAGAHLQEVVVVRRGPHAGAGSAGVAVAHLHTPTHTYHQGQHTPSPRPAASHVRRRHGAGNRRGRSGESPGKERGTRLPISQRTSALRLPKGNGDPPCTQQTTHKHER